MQTMIKKWLKVATINLGIVAFLGVILRYKIAFSLPFIDQKNLHHGHSHFAFSGWITMAIMILLVYYLHQNGKENSFKKYAWVLFANLITSYGMLISFPIQGYAFFSLLFSTLSIFISYAFAIIFWRDLNKLNVNRNAHLWFKAALFFNVISSIGPFCLAFMIANHLINQKIYLIAELFYLHFQYNGWFLFACIGLFISYLNEFTGEKKSLKYIFGLFLLSCVPCFFLSALWIPMHPLIYILVVISAILQLFAWIWLIRIVYNNFSTLKKEFPDLGKWLTGIAAISMTIKLILQLGSSYSPLSQLVFGFRPIVIGYLHLVLLGAISIFLLGYIFSKKLLAVNRTVTMGVLIFVSGVFINELLLMTQGGLALVTKSISHMDILLFIAAIIMFSGILMINIKKSPPHF